MSLFSGDNGKQQRSKQCLTRWIEHLPTNNGTQSVPLSKDTLTVVSSELNNFKEVDMQAFYIVISIILGVLYAAFPDEKLYVGFFGRIGIFILATIFAYVGTLVGDYLRKIAIPDSIITTGGMSQILKEKLFWFIGPQCIGAIIGGACGSTIITYIFY